MKLWMVSTESSADNPYRDGSGGLEGAVVACDDEDTAIAMTRTFAHEHCWENALGDIGLVACAIGEATATEPTVLMCCWSS